MYTVKMYVWAVNLTNQLSKLTFQFKLAPNSSKKLELKKTWQVSVNQIMEYSINRIHKDISQVLYKGKADWVEIGSLGQLNCDQCLVKGDWIRGKYSYQGKVYEICVNVKAYLPNQA